MAEELVPFGADADEVPVRDPEELNKVGFHPSYARPFPGVQCRGVIRNGDRAGEQCKKRATLGGYLCIVHGGQLPNNKKFAASVVAAARLRLVSSSEDAADILIDLAQNATSDAVRLGAANSILDRIGLKAGTDVNVTVTNGESPHDVLAERLLKLRSRVVEGEVVHSEDEVGDTVAIEADPLHPTEE